MCSSWGICAHVETSYFMIFQNILGTTKNIWNCRDVFKFYWVPFSTQSFQLNLLDLGHVIFSQKGCFCVVINLIFKKVVTSLLVFFALSKSNSQTHNSFLRYELNYRCFWRIFFEISRTPFFALKTAGLKTVLNILNVPCLKLLAVYVPKYHWELTL